MRPTFVALLALAACGSPAADIEPDPGVALLGGLGHTLDDVVLEVIGDAGEELFTPRDLAFDPEVPDRLWTVNAGDDAVVIFFDASSDARTSERIVDPYALHFMDDVSSIAFGDPGLFATCQNSRNTYNGWGQPNDFMGPALWSSDLEIFGTSNPEAVEYLSNKYGMPVDLGSHLDMLHDTPLCMGIAWEQGNAYWTFDGATGSISRQDFVEDHGVGWDDHNDGEILRYVEGEVKRTTDVSSHLVYEPDTELLYIADTGNGRIAVLDTTTGTLGDRLPQVDERPYPVHNRMDGAVITTLVADLGEPSGLELHDGLLFVSEHETGRISAYTLQGELVDWLDTGRDGLMGMAFGPDGALYLTDASADELVRISALPAAPTD